MRPQLLLFAAGVLIGQTYGEQASSTSSSSSSSSSVTKTASTTTTSAAWTGGPPPGFGSPSQFSGLPSGFKPPWISSLLQNTNQFTVTETVSSTASSTSDAMPGSTSSGITTSTTTSPSGTSNATLSDTTLTPSSVSNNTGTAVGVGVGVGVGIAVVLVGAAVFAFWYFKKRQRRRGAPNGHKDEEDANPRNNMNGGTSDDTSYTEVDTFLIGGGSPRRHDGSTITPSEMATTANTSQMGDETARHEMSGDGRDVHEMDAVEKENEAKIAGTEKPPIITELPANGDSN